MKKLLAISMALVLALALCACGGGSSSESKSNGFVGKWEMESYNSTVSQADDHTLEVKMEILDDKSFSYSESETDSQGHYLKTIVSGTCRETPVFIRGSDDVVTVGDGLYIKFSIGVKK